MRWSKRFPAVIAAIVVMGCALPFVEAAVQQQSPTPSASPTPGGAPGTKQVPSGTADEAQKRAQPQFFVMIDPSHGGADKGAVFGKRFTEKEVTLSLARELKKELEQRGFAVRMLREGDITLGLDRRAEITNEQHSGIYVALHAGPPGQGVRVYAPLLPAPQAAVGKFVPWESAQSGSLERSRAAARAVVHELQKRNLQTASFGAPLRPLNNIVTPAIAVELAPSRGDARSLESPRLQTTVASAIAAGLAQVRTQMGGRL